MVAIHNGKPVHCRSHGRYMIFYRIDAEQISVVTVTHAARDPKRWFKLS